MIFSLIPYLDEQLQYYRLQFYFGLPLSKIHTYIYNYIIYIYINIYIYNIKFSFKFLPPAEKKTVICNTVIGVACFRTFCKPYQSFYITHGKPAKFSVCPKLFSIFAAFFGRKVWWYEIFSVSLHSQKDEDGDLIGRHANAQRAVRILRHFPVKSPSFSRFEVERSPLRRPSGRTIDKKRTNSRRKAGQKPKGELDEQPKAHVQRPVYKKPKLSASTHGETVKQ